jgi:hypothetical protein
MPQITRLWKYAHPKAKESIVKKVNYDKINKVVDGYNSMNTNVLKIGYKGE